MGVPLTEPLLVLLEQAGVLRILLVPRSVLPRIPRPHLVLHYVAQVVQRTQRLSRRGVAVRVHSLFVDGLHEVVPHGLPELKGAEDHEDGVAGQRVLKPL